MPDTAAFGAFRKTVKAFYRRHGRDLPWRHTDDPYRILLSEIMLQQTQVSRVMGKYEAFLERFPDIASLAGAPLQDIMEAWQGLGYNRRALSLKKLAEKVVQDFGGTIPEREEDLKRLPGIGSATAAAICAFAWNQPVVFLETNIRAVYIHHFFDGSSRVGDEELLPLVALTLDRKNPRRWYNALMDYGVFLKKRHANPARGSERYRKQAPFEGSDRQIRGAILRILVERPGISEEELAAELPFEAERIGKNVDGLVREGMVTKKGSSLFVG